jgi:hypothetical protein
VTNVDEAEVVPKQVRPLKGPLIHHPGCQPEQKKCGSFLGVLMNFQTTPAISMTLLAKYSLTLDT